MRKIDAVILSALILYDYSAQTLVDSDIMNLGSSVVKEYNSSSIHEISTDILLPEDTNINIISVNKSQQKKVDVLDATPAKNISYYDLAKINPVALLQDDGNQLVHISVPDPFIEETALLPESQEIIYEESSHTLTLSSVATSVNLLSDAGNVEMKDENTDGKLQFADTDADGMFDFEDQCPNIPGVARFEGCPVPDSDQDGINDEEDHCPFEVGTIEGNGCALTTEMSIADNNITESEAALNNEHTDVSAIKFDLNSGVLSNNDFNILLQMADKVLLDSNAKINMSAYGDQKSEKEVNTIKQYFKDLGVTDKQINVLEKKAESNNIVVRGVGVQIAY